MLAICKIAIVSFLQKTDMPLHFIKHAEDIK